MVVYQPENSFSVHELCEALDVARGTFYNHIFRRADRTKYEREQEDLMQKVQRIFDDSSQRFGTEKIRVTLAACGIRVSTRRITAIMQELDLHSVRPEAKKDFKKRQQARKQNLLKRDFFAACPNQVWVSDITYFRVNGYWLYFCAILDLCSRRVVGFRISRNASTNLVTSAFRKAYQDRGQPKNLTFHSDRGAQYTSGAFTALLQKCGVRQSFSASGRPHDNAVAESFFASFKKKRRTAESTPQNRVFEKASNNMLHFIIPAGRIKR